jgi:hypothetical protein
MKRIIETDPAAGAKKSPPLRTDAEGKHFGSS